MCDAERKLIAWLDRELPPKEAARVECHVEGCTECRRRVAAYEQISKTIDAYCEAVVTRDTRQRIPAWVPVLSGAAMAVVLAVLLFMRTPVESRAVVAPPKPAASMAIEHVGPQMAPTKAVHRHHPLSNGPVSATKWQPAETTVQIAIPAEAMFAPGALPKGMNFIAELRIAPDGSVEQVRLRQ